MSSTRIYNTWTEQQVYDAPKNKRDLTVLKYMVRRLHLALYEPERTTSSETPQLSMLQERHGRKHRLALYQYQDLFLKKSLPFVGFISHKQKDLDQAIVKEIQEIDNLLVQELAYSSEIVSYSSLELSNGDWCNLVIMKDIAAKTHVKSLRAHKRAAYDLAYHYYEWIRLHNGVLAEGLDHAEMQLQTTTYYVFPQEQPVGAGR